jgi:hypothetical protein
MSKKLKESEDDLRPEYDFTKLQIVADGPGRKPRGEVTVKLEPDVAKRFPDSQSVNRALRLIIDVAEQA